MILESKFNIGDIVYYWSMEKIKVLRGEITSISTYSYKENGGIKNTFKYYVNPNTGTISLSECIPEHLIFKEREDVFEFCMALTKDI